ncbi:Uncharacterised protein [Chlamydia trachomatis]|nr:Uncharacterised protein [Chlamydia trachomatis]
MGGGQGAVMAKAAMYLQGVIETPVLRLPLVGASDDEMESLKSALKVAELL